MTPDGVTATRTYDRAGRLLEIANTELDGTLWRVTYAYDAAGNRTEQTTSLGTTYDAYDASNRLTSACTAPSCAPLGGAPLACLACVAGTVDRPAATTQPDPADTRTTYTYDPVGNRTAMTTYLGTTTYAYDAADRLTSSSGPGATTYTYDAVGNELTAGTATYTYDLADRLVSATVGTTTVTYTWSGDGIRRSAATGTGAATTDFLVDRNFGLPEIALERDGTGTLLRTSTYGLERISVINASGGIAYEHPDGLGSVTDLVSSSGVALGWTDYGPYGAIRSAGALAGVPADAFGFTGAYLDGTTGLYHLRARQYDPATGRFLSTDPAAGAGSGFGALYLYASANPLRFTDPAGLCDWNPLNGGNYWGQEACWSVISAGTGALALALALIPVVDVASAPLGVVSVATGGASLVNDLANNSQPVNIAFDAASLVPGAASLKFERAAITAAREASVAARAFQSAANGSSVDVALRFAAQSAQVGNAARELRGTATFFGLFSNGLSWIDVARGGLNGGVADLGVGGASK